MGIDEGRCSLCEGPRQASSLASRGACTTCSDSRGCEEKRVVVAWGEQTVAAAAAVHSDGFGSEGRGRSLAEGVVSSHERAPSSSTRSSTSACGDNFGRRAKGGMSSAGLHREPRPAAAASWHLPVRRVKARPPFMRHMAAMSTTTAHGLHAGKAGSRLSGAASLTEAETEEESQKLSLRRGAALQAVFAKWLGERGELDALEAAVAIGESKEGRGLFAAKAIRKGDRLVKVSRSLILTPANLDKDVQSVLTEEASEWARLALVLLAEQAKGEESMWAPYIAGLPALLSLDSTVFWSEDELELLEPSELHAETYRRRTMIAEEWEAVRDAVAQHPGAFRNAQIDFERFEHAYTLVCSRSWHVDSVGALCMVPFADFFNHDPGSTALLQYDEESSGAEILSDRDYSPGQQVSISYGELPNAKLALDYGFTVPGNAHDSASVWVAIPITDPLRPGKLAVLNANGVATERASDGSDSGGAWFEIKESPSPARRGKGIPQSLKVLARVAVAASHDELAAIVRDAERHGRRIMRRVPRGRREARAMLFLLEQLERTLEAHKTATIARCRRDEKEKREGDDVWEGGKNTHRANMAKHVREGEERVLRSAVAWLRPRAEGGGYEDLLGGEEE